VVKFPELNTRRWSNSLLSLAPFVKVFFTSAYVLKLVQQHVGDQCCNVLHLFEPWRSENDMARHITSFGREHEPVQPPCM
jgi:hypothetical protein